MENGTLLAQEVAKKLFDAEKYDELIELGKQNEDDINVQCQVLKVYIKMGNYDKVNEMVKKYQNEILIETQIAKMYINEGKYNAAIKICEKFPNDDAIMLLLFKIYIKMKNDDKAIEIGKKFLDNEQIQSQMIKLYFEKGKEYYNEIIKIGERFSNNERIQLQLVKFYFEIEDFEKAIEIGKKFPDFVPIQEKILRICLINNNITEIIKIKEKFSDNKIIQKIIAENFSDEYMEKTICETNCIEEQKKSYNSDIMHQLGVIRTKLHLNKIQLIDIETVNQIKEEISNEDYYVILAAIYERLGNKKKAINILKNNISSKEINKIVESIKSSRIYDIAKYDFYIKWPINVKYKEEVIKTESKKQIEINPVNDNKKKKKKAKPKMISGTMGTLKKEKNRVKEEEIKKITIYDILTYEEKEKALKIKLLLYLNMYGEDEVRKQAIKKYDVLTSYLESDSSNIKALNVIHRVLETDYPKIPEYIKQKKLV